MFGCKGLILILKDFKLENLPIKVYLSGSGAGLEILQKGLQKLTLSPTLNFQGQIEVELLPLSQLMQVGADLAPGDEFSSTTLAGLGQLAGDILNVVQNVSSNESNSPNLE